jgi:predicted Zn-dependent protease
VQKSIKTMRKITIRRIVAISIITASVIACSRVPITGRRQAHLLPESMLMNESNLAYTQFLNTNKKVADTESNSQLVKRVGSRIQAAVTQYMNQHKLSSRIAGYKWEYNLVEDNTVNAWCMPGGKVVIYTGILPITQTEDGLAIVMGHEIAHAIARHGNERMTQAIGQQVGGLTLDIFMQTKGMNPAAMNLFNQVYGGATTLGMLKYSRLHESEADKMGLIFAAMAGYNPNAAVPFWQRMSALGGQKPPELLSTHPSDERRIKDLNAYMPTAMKYYKPQQ